MPITYSDLLAATKKKVRELPLAELKAKLDAGEEAARLVTSAYDEVLESLWGDAQETEALRAIRAHLDGAETADRLGHQAPVSFRIVPRLLGQARRAVDEVERAATVALRSVTQNPVYVPRSPDDRQTSESWSEPAARG